MTTAITPSKRGISLSRRASRPTATSRTPCRIRLKSACGTGRQPIQRDKTESDNYYLLTLTAVAKELKRRGEKPENAVTIAAGLPLASFGREKKRFREYLLRSPQLVCFRYEGQPYRVTIQDVKLFPAGLFSHRRPPRARPRRALAAAAGYQRLDS